MPLFTKQWIADACKKGFENNIPIEDTVFFLDTRIEQSKE